MDGTFKSVWAAAGDHCIKAMQCETKISSGNNANWPTFTGSWKQSNNNDSNKDADEKQSHSNSGLGFCAKKTKSAPFKIQGPFTVSTPKNDLNLQTSEDFEAIPEEFRPNETIRNLLPVRKNPVIKNVRMFNYKKEESNSTLKHESCYEKNLKENLNSTDFRNTTPKGIKWNDNLKPDFSEIVQQINRKMHDSNLESKDIKQQKKGINSLRNSIPNNFLPNANKDISKSCDSRKQHLSRLSPEKLRVNGTRKKHQSPSLTVISEVTKLSVVTPEAQVQTQKTIQKRTTNPTAEATWNKIENKAGQDEVLFENISRKSVRKKMVWMDDLCTVKEISETDEVIFKYISGSKSSFSPHDRKKTHQQQKSCSFFDNLRTNNNKKDFTGDYMSPKNAFADHAEEFIKAQYRYKSERESRKFKRITIPNRQSKEEAPVIKHEVYVNRPNRRKGKRGCRVKKRNNCPKPASDEQQQPENKSPDMSCQSVDSDENDSPIHLKEINETIFQYSPQKTMNAQRLFKNKSKINAVEEGIRGLFTKSEDIEESYPIFSKTNQTCFKNLKDSEDIKNKRSLLIYYGAEISNTIVGSYSAMNMFLSFYKEWKNLRLKAMQLLEDIINNLTSTSNKRNKTKDVIEMFGSGGRLVAAIPDYRAALAGRIIAVVSDFFAKLFSSSRTLKDSGMNEFELMMILQQDIDATSDMNIFGLQCDQNFQETCKLIEEFHTCIQGWCFKDITEGLDTDFLEDISKLNPKHHLVYYRRLQKWMESLAENPTSDISKEISRGFQDFPEALKITNLLYWRYHAQGFDRAVSLRSWNDVHELLQNGDSIAIVDVIKKIQNSILVLIKERSAMEKDVMELLQYEKGL